MNSTCRLCRTHKVVLKESHVIPSFVGKYLKRTSATGFLISVSTSGETSRVQDLFKTHLLCEKCEQCLNRHETFVADNIFYPYKRNSLQSIPTDEHIGRFTVSISLRALWMLLETNDPLAMQWKDSLVALETEWRNYLLETPGFTKGPNTHHLLLSSPELLAAGLKTAPNLVLAIFRTSAYYIDEQFGKAFIFSNMAGMQTLSMVSPTQMPVCRGTEVYPKQTLGVQHPPGIGWGGYFQTILGLNQRCDEAGRNISQRHDAMIERSASKNPQRVLNSEDLQIINWQKKRLHDLNKGKFDHEET